MKIEFFKINGLFSEKNYEIKIKENKIVIVADNGSGKTTILRLLYFFLTKQWAKLSTYQFDFITAIIDGKEYRFETEEFLGKKVSKKTYNDLAKRYKTFANFILKDFSKFDITHLKTNSSEIDEIEQKYDVPKTLILSLIESLEVARFDGSKYDWEVNVLYLPTYRRIERDYFSLYGDVNSRVVSSVLGLFPEIKKKIQREKDENGELFSESETQLNKLFSNIIDSRNNEKWSKNDSNSESIEMIEFGMSDVNYKLQLFIERKNQNYEGLVQDFEKLINKYLSHGKILSCDFESQQFIVKNSANEKTFDLESLSSGEKQLISIFSHIYFDENTPFVIIDEPEISLSLYWQEMILNDVISKSLGMAVATHSPFIVSENLKEFAAGINEFVR